MLFKGGRYSVFFHQTARFLGIKRDGLCMKKRENPEKLSGTSENHKLGQFLLCPEKTCGQKGSAVSKSRVLPPLSLLPHCAEAQEGILVLSTPETPGSITASMSAQICSPITVAELFKVKMERHMYMVGQPEPSMKTHGRKGSA